MDDDEIYLKENILDLDYPEKMKDKLEEYSQQSIA